MSTDDAADRREQQEDDASTAPFILPGDD